MACRQIGGELSLFRLPAGCRWQTGVDDGVDANTVVRLVENAVQRREAGSAGHLRTRAGCRHSRDWVFVPLFPVAAGGPAIIPHLAYRL